ncbi:odorant receptor 85c-like [Odontomachus brunneus]|uniref:odorant receptor 85c-like n=1 Tax=Odontomachus brunneus TaxID=486640 RepID=UPI0013F2A16E|nr:odorant receptor 85c-like [Odontomachus brunneus]
MAHWNQDAAYALASYKILAWPLGAWPIDDDTFYSKMRWLFAMISELLLVTSLATEICLSCENSYEDPIDTYVVISSAILVLVKLSLLRMRRSTLSINLSCAIQDWSDVKDPISREIMMQHARIARTISLSLFYCGFFAFMLYMLRLLPFLNATGQRMYYLPTSCLLKSVSNVEYVVVTFYQVIQLFITYAGNCCTEGIFVGITLHLCGQLELLMINFRRIDQCKCKGDNIVAKLVVRHRHLLRLTETIEDSYNVIILTQIFTSAILICITGKFTSLFFTEFSIVVMIVMLLQSFLYSYAGDNLRDQSEALSFAVYNSNWCDFPSSDIRDLAFIMIKTNIPIRLTAGKFFYVTRATFTDILKTSVSYLSALRVMLEKQTTNSY